MRTIDRASRFRRDLKRESKGQHRLTLDQDLADALYELVNDRPLEPRYRDHQLTGNWVGCRDCHVYSDLVLIYRKPDAVTLQLIRLGSHSELRI